MSPLANGSATDQVQAQKVGLDGGQVLYLRSEVVLRAQVDGDSIETGFIPHRVTWHDGGHKRATEVTVEIHGSALPYPLEHVASGFVSLYQGVADTPTGSVRTADNLCFCGYFEEEEIDDGERTVEFKARDLSALLRDHTPLIPKRMDDGRTIDPTPRYSDTIRQAIKRIMSVVPGFADPSARDILTLREVPSLDLRLGDLVDGRAKSGPIGLPPKCSAWDAIEIVCGLASRMVGVELGELVVREPHEAFRVDGGVDYTFIFGSANANALGVKRHKKFTRNRKGIKLVAWNPDTRKRMEAVYPSDTDMRSNFPRHRPKATTHKPATHSTKKPAKDLPPPDRDVQDIGSAVVSQSKLDELAERVWIEKSMHEVDGTVTSPIWDRKLLDMRNGARVAVKIRPDLEAQVRGLQTDEERAQYLQEALGIDAQPARALVRIAMQQNDDLYSVAKVTREWPGKTAITVGFVNLYRV